MLTDSHCHLAEAAFDGRRAETLRQARAAGVRRLIVPSARLRDWDAVETVQCAPQIYGAIGLHPWYADEAGGAWLADLAGRLRRCPQLLVGEIGLDYYGERRQQAAVQQQVFAEQLAVAKEYRRPVILHHLRAAGDVAGMLKRQRFDCGGIAHAFSGSREEAAVWIRLGLLIGIGTLVLNPSARRVRQAAAELPLRHLVLETDSPFAGGRGEEGNTPAAVRAVAGAVAQLRGADWREVAAATEENIGRLLAGLAVP